MAALEAQHSEGIAYFSLVLVGKGLLRTVIRKLGFFFSIYCPPFLRASECSFLSLASIQQLGEEYKHRAARIGSSLLLIFLWSDPIT